MATETVVGKADLIENVAQRAGVSKIAAANTVKAVTECVKNGLKRGFSVRLDIGTFKTARSPQRKGRNPKTGAPLTIAAKGRVTFSPSKPLKDAVSGVKAAKK